MLRFFYWEETWSNELTQRTKIASWLHLPLIEHVTMHLTKNVYFLSEMLNFRQIRDLDIPNVARFTTFNAVFPS